MAKKPSSNYDDKIDYDEGLKIDFGKYIETVVRQWGWIAACALVLGILAFAYTLISNHTSPSYTANVLVASLQTASKADFGSTIDTASDIEMAATTGGLFYDRQTRLQSFVSQIQNGTVADQVLQEIGPIIDSNGKSLTAGDLLGMVSGNLIPKTDTIQILVTYYDPVIAAKVANAWGEAYVQHINELYGVTSAGSSYLTTEAEVSQAKSDFDKAEVVLDDFIAHDKTEEYNRDIEDLTNIITLLRAARSSAGEQQINDHQVRLEEAYANRRLCELFIADAVYLRAAVNAGGEPAAISNALALTMLKTEIYSNFEGTNTLQVQNLPEALGTKISSVNAAGMVADLDALIPTLTTYKSELDNQIKALSSEVQNEEYLMNFSYTNTPIENKIAENEQQVRDLKSLASSQASTLGELTGLRDLAGEKYSALAAKATEMSVNTQNNQVVLASSATTSIRSGTSSKVAAIWGTGIGMLVGIIIAYAYEFWQNYKRRQPEVITKLIFTSAKNLLGLRTIKSRKE